jgi:hypothetical protein
VFHWRKLYQAGLLGTVMFGTNAEFDAVNPYVRICFSVLNSERVDLAGGSQIGT